MPMPLMDARACRYFRGSAGRIVWQGKFELMLIGPTSGENWDHVFIAEYPSVDAFVEMIRDPIYREAVKHRQAAVETSRLIRLKPLTPGKGFRRAGVKELYFFSSISVPSF